MSASVQQFASRLREAMLLINQLESKLEAVQRAKTEPIAIVGLGCRFAGGATGPEAFWRLLDTGADAITEVPPERWSIPREDTSGVRWGSYLKDVDLFDPQFFEISPREAVSMDPQQRLLLEVTWEALEHAGQVPEKLMGSRTAVFVGVTTADYMRLCDADPDAQDIYTVTGNAHAFPSGRLSYVLGLQGPSFTIDSACSSSLVAVHLACQSLRSGESTMALAGGVNLILAPAITELLSKTGALSPDGHCRSFDAQANGFVRGEGCGVVVLKRLSDALADGDRIHALIRGSAVNQDGRSTGLTAPNVLSQQALLRQALLNAGVSPADIGYVETHGTGTSLGDPIEIDALSAVLGAPRADGSVCVLGAVKTNLGHVEAAAGIAGLIKVVLSMQHQKIPQNLHFKTLNPRISLDGTPLVIPTKALSWQPFGKPRFAGVSAFGMSGTNAHLVLEEAPATAASASAEDGMTLLPLSAKSPAALLALAASYRTFLAENTAEPLRDIAYTASVRRGHHEHRLVLFGRSREEFIASLAAFEQGELLPGVIRGEVPAQVRPKVVFVYPGQGSQWVGMGQTLLAEEPVFRRAMEACDAVIQREAGFSVIDELCTGEERSKLARLDIVQPTLFAVEVALTALWRSWGVEPDAVIGHSMGEVAAAHAASVLSLEDAAAIICRRSRLLQTLSGQGVMAWCELTKERTEQALRGYESRLSIAASNGPKSTVLSGDREALSEVLNKLAQENVLFRRVMVSDTASHSPKMDPLLGDVMAALSGISPCAAQVPMYSTVTAEVCQGEELRAAYWVRNLREAVLFSQTVERLLGEGFTLFVEVSPQPVLLPSIEENARHKGAKAVVLSSLRRGREAQGELFSSLGALYTLGYPVDFSALYPTGGRCVPLPTYPFQRERYWVEASTNDVAERLLVSRKAARRVGDRDAALPRDPCESWLYSLSWCRKDNDLAAANVVPASSGALLVWIDRGGVGAALCALLAERGEAYVQVVAGERYARLDEGLYQVDPSDPEGYRTVLREAFNRERPCRGVLHLFSLDTTAAADSSAETLLVDQRLSCSSVLFLAQALLRAGFRDLPRLVLVTRGAQAVFAEDVVQVSQAPLWGLGRTLGIEHPELRCTRVDLSPRPMADEASALLRAFTSSDKEDQIALREPGRYVARLVQGSFDAATDRASRPTIAKASAPLAGVAGADLRSDASYLITGGLGAMGLSVAAWMVREGARHLVLVGRTPPSDAARAAIAALEAADAEVLVMQADVSTPSEVARVLAEIASRMPKLAGVVHAAAVLDDKAMLQMSRASLDKVMAPKVQGAWNLHVLTADMPLDFFVMCSSLSSLLGSPQQANNAAANAFLDALAFYRRTLGLAGLSINWGPVSFAGLSSAQGAERPLYRGVASLEPAQAFSVLRRLLSSEVVQVGVVDLNLRQWLEFYPSTAGAPLWADLLKDRRPSAPIAGALDDFRQDMERAKADDRPALLEKHLGEQVGRILRLRASRIDRFAGFSSLGMDSLMSLELRNRLEASLALNLSVTTLFTYPNLAALTTYLLKEMQFVDAPKEEALSLSVNESNAIESNAIESNAIEKSVEQLSKDELLALFDEPSAPLDPGQL